MGTPAISPSRSEELLSRALRTIPWGTQTNAKRPIPAMAGAMPYFIERARGCRMWDVDGREFVDYRAALGPILLGYCYPSVDEAAKAQIGKGVLFGMASPIEIEVAELIAALLPWAEKVRFLKTGADACSAALRIARTYTGRTKFISCGYHGWHDAFAAAAQGADRGVPDALAQQIYPLSYGDEETAESYVKEHGDEIAAIVTVPYDLGEDTTDCFLKKLRDLADRSGCLLIYDEIITGFRLARGGAAQYYHVEPDMVVLGKALANGYPLTAFAGKAEYMSVLDQNRVLITTTYAGETVSLAAAQATLSVLKSEPVHDHVWQMGQRLMDGFHELGRVLGIPLRPYGLAPCSGLRFEIENHSEAARLHDAFWRELFRQGVFPNSTWFISYSHSRADIDTTLEKAETAMRRAIS